LLLAAGWALGNAIIGRYLNPRILNVDVKMFFLFNIGLLGHLTLCAIITVEAFHQQKLSAALILMMFYTTVMFLSFVLFQVYVSSCSVAIFSLKGKKGKGTHK